LGSGRTASRVLKELGKRLNNKNIRPVGVPTSGQIKLEVLDYYLISEPNFSFLDLVIDGADQVSSYNGYIIKGGGGHLQRKG
jgi:Ribose 5-phosphate isomerase